jgi:hypothetical protein
MSKAGRAGTPPQEEHDVADKTYRRGETVTLQASFTEDGNADDQATLPTLSIRRRGEAPLAVVPTVQHAGAGTGTYFAEFVPVEDGTYFWRLEGDDTAYEGVFDVSSYFPV